MKIELLKITDVRPCPGNLSQNGAMVDAVAASIRNSCFRWPIVVDAKGRAVCGHTRYKAARKLGLRIRRRQERSPRKRRGHN